MAIPMPVVTAETAPFWEGCNASELRYQQCTECGHVQIIPRALCGQCQATALAWRRSNGEGRVATYTVVRRPPPAFRDRAPYVIAIVDLDEGFRLMVNMRANVEPGVDARVRIGFRQEGEQALPEAELLS